MNFIVCAVGRHIRQMKATQQAEAKQARKAACDQMECNYIVFQVLHASLIKCVCQQDDAEKNRET